MALRLDVRAAAQIRGWIRARICARICARGRGRILRPETRSDLRPGTRPDSRLDSRSGSRPDSRSDAPRLDVAAIDEAVTRAAARLDSVFVSVQDCEQAVSSRDTCHIKDRGPEISDLDEEQRRVCEEIR